MSTALSVNLNKIALLRNSREGDYPSVLHYARLCLEAGVAGLTVHPRPDQRHIRPQDVRDLQQLLQSHTHVEFNIEGNPFAGAKDNYPGFMPLVLEAKPHQCTLVPDSDEQLTSDHGFDLIGGGEKLAPLIASLQQAGIRVSLFMDPDPEQIRAAKTLGADRIELYTGPYAAACLSDTDAARELLARYRTATDTARDCGLGVNAGHDLNLDNLPAFLTIPGILEVSIGHALTVDALNMGFRPALDAYLALCRVSA